MQKFVRYHNVILPSAVKDSFALMAEDMYRNLGIALEPLDGFKPQVVIKKELLNRLKYPDQGKVYSDAEIDAMDPLEFEPPLVGNKAAKRDTTGNEQVYTIPNKLNLDPRITGRILKIGPKNIINPTTLYYLVHNAGTYGFLHYGPIDPTIWYWRGDKEPKVYTAQQVVSTFSDELSYLL